LWVNLCPAKDNASSGSFTSEHNFADFVWQIGNLLVWSQIWLYGERTSLLCSKDPVESVCSFGPMANLS
jgi:hypothetical protein